ncbi:uncharacterized protein LTR77_008730 [Saxophila tyrrhenica]|uniref:Uncharacterized protein n=1 Tax=Saxophila tyrrhenica TaxID=1690608 RepID=A0AAV9P0W6_9PEZI|nr:hypothetical protein LTR77_008730 [Saxophila tyrrhenica]
MQGPWKPGADDINNLGTTLNASSSTVAADTSLASSSTHDPTNIVKTIDKQTRQPKTQTTSLLPASPTRCSIFSEKQIGIFSLYRDRPLLSGFGRRRTNHEDSGRGKPLNHWTQQEGGIVEHNLDMKPEDDTELLKTIMHELALDNRHLELPRKLGRTRSERPGEVGFSRTG